MPRTNKKLFYHKPLSFQQVFSNIGDTSKVIQQEPGKTVQKSYFEAEILQRFRF